MNFTIYRWIPIIVAVTLGGMVNPAAARPPSAVDLSYDTEKKDLHIEVHHVASNPRKHFIRKLSIDKNGQEVDSRSYAKQTTATMLIEDVPLEAVTGDVVRVEAICSEAGRKEATLVVP